MTGLQAHLPKLLAIGILVGGAELLVSNMFGCSSGPQDAFATDPPHL